MSEVLVLVEQYDGVLAKVTGEMLSAAAKLGTPAAVVVGKPGTADVARRRWRQMRGRTGVLRTGHWLVDARDPDEGGTGASLGELSSTLVRFADLDDAEIDAYVATGEPLEVAGAFTVDGLGGAYVEGIEGDHHGVVGLSLPLLRDLLGELGVTWHTLWRDAPDAS